MKRDSMRKVMGRGRLGSSIFIEQVAGAERTMNAWSN